MESNESSNMATGTNSPIDIVQSLMQDQGYLQEAFESSYESMDFLNQPDSATSSVAKDETSKTYAPEEFLNEPVRSQAAEKNNDSTQSEFERLLNEDIVDDTDDIVADLSSEAVTFLDKASEEFGIVSKTISDNDVGKPNEKINDDNSNKLKLGLGDKCDEKKVDKINQVTSPDVDLGLNEADDKTEETTDQESSKDASSDEKIEETVSQDSSKNVGSDDKIREPSSDEKMEEMVSQDSSKDVSSDDKIGEPINQDTSKDLSSVDKIEETVSQDSSKDVSSDDEIGEPINQDTSKDMCSVDKKEEKISQDSSKDVSSVDKIEEIVSQESTKDASTDDKIEETINQDSSKDRSLGLDDASDSGKSDKEINQDVSKDLSLGLHVSSDAKKELEIQIAESSTLTLPKSSEEGSDQITKEKADTDAQSKKEDETSESLIQIETIAIYHSSPKKMLPDSSEKEPDKTNDICNNNNAAEIVTTESLEAMLESLDGPAAPDLIESEGSTNSITVSNTFTRESLQELMEETPSASEQDDWLMTPVNKRSAPVDCVTADDVVSNTTLDDTHSCLDMNIKEEIESENEISFTETFCERSCLIDQDTDRHNFKMFECKVLSIDLHDIIKCESARDAKAGLYKPSERKCIDIIRKEFKTKAMQDYIRRAKRMKLPSETTTRRSNQSQFSSPVRMIIDKTVKASPKTPTTAKSAVGHRTPVTSAKKSITQSSIKTPARSSDKTPARSSDKTPARSSNKTPARSSNKTPARSSVKTPSGSSSFKTPSQSSNKTSSSQNSVKTPSARRAIKTPSRFFDDTPADKTPIRSTIKTSPSTLSTRSSVKTQSQAVGKNTRKRTLSEIQTPKRARNNQEEEISPRASKKVKLSPDKKKMPISSKKKKTKDNVSFETATKLLTIDLQDIMKISKYSKLIKGNKSDLSKSSKSKGRNVKRAGIYRKPIRSKEIKKTNVKMPLKEVSKKKAPVKLKSPSKAKLEVKSKSIPTKSAPKSPKLDLRSTRTSTRKKPLSKSSNEVQSVKRLRPKRDSEGKFVKKKQSIYIDDYDDDIFDEDYQPSKAEANYTCFDCMEDFETNAELKVHKRLEHNKSTTDTPRKTPAKTASKKKNKNTVPVYFKSDQYRIDRTVGKKSMKEFQPATEALNKDDMIQGANMVNHHITFYNHELGRNVTDQEIYQHMMKKYTIKSAQLCIGSNRFRSYYQLANSPDTSNQTKINTIKEERGHVLITSPLLHW